MRANLHITYLHFRKFTLAAVWEIGLREIKPELWRSISYRNVGKRKSWSELWMALWMEEVGTLEGASQSDWARGVSVCGLGNWIDSLR